jgi:hypothetical protein
MDLIYGLAGDGRAYAHTRGAGPNIVYALEAGGAGG